MRTGTQGADDRAHRPCQVDIEGRDLGTIENTLRGWGPGFGSKIVKKAVGRVGRPPCSWINTQRPVARDGQSVRLASYY